MRKKVVGLFSGGIDSPVACALVGRRCEVVPVYFNPYPYTSVDSVRLALDSMMRAKSAIGFRLAIVVPWRGVMDRIALGLSWKEYTCVVCKHAMLRAADALCEETGAFAMVTGESLGQKASQTLENIVAISHGITRPILRPLLGLDKVEIEALSKKMGLWSERHAGECRAVPGRPRTRSRGEDVRRLFEELGLQEEIESALEKRIEMRGPRSISRVLEDLK